MDGIKIPFSETVKYLGVTLKSKISWKPHIENKTVACKKLMVMLNSNLRGMQAPKPKLSKWECTGVVRPKLLYTCMTWGISINTVQQMKKLKTLIDWQCIQPQLSGYLRLKSKLKTSKKIHNCLG